ncbi:MAG: hypothetical protein RLZZ08_889 [Pseudomonadota bacterium]|jgi:L-seryl-tRNA(Ser) seleniumtransferase
MNASASRPPAVSRVLETPLGRDLVARHGHGPAVAAIRAAADAARSGLAEATPDSLAALAAQALSADRPALRPVWNLTGTVLHTNLGRAILPPAAIAAASAAMARPVALEYDLATGQRGERDDAVRPLLRGLTGAADAVLVNNNAAAVVLVLDTLAKGGEVIVSRGELIEIGGAFRMPDIMAATGAVLREVGATNRTHLKDYAAAIGPETRAIMKVHPSNFRIEGFTSDVSAAELAPLARAHGIPLVNDLGSGTLVDPVQYGLPPEPTVAQAVAEGADVVTFSGDKLLGGPQAGFAVGRADLIERMRRNPLKRALRLDKIRLAALEAVLREMRKGVQLPTQRLLARDVADIAAAAERLAAPVAAVLGGGFTVEPAPSRSQVGSGASPTATQPSFALAIHASGSALDGLAAALRALPEPVIGRIADGALWLDLRCLEQVDEAAFLANLAVLALP